MMFKIGDKVQIVKYGDLLCCSKNEWDRWVKEFSDKPGIKPTNLISEDANFYCYDTAPELIGRDGLIDSIGTDGRYGIKLPNCSLPFWFSEEQLKLIS